MPMWVHGPTTIGCFVKRHWKFEIKRRLHSFYPDRFRCNYSEFVLELSSSSDRNVNKYPNVEIEKSTVWIFICCAPFGWARYLCLWTIVIGCFGQRRHFMNRIFFRWTNGSSVNCILPLSLSKFISEVWDEEKYLRKINSNERKGSANYLSHTKIEWYYEFWQNIWIIPAYKWSWIN